MKKQKKPVVYLAGPLGFSEAGKKFCDETLKPAIAKRGIKVLDPWELTPNELINTAQNLPYGQERKDKWTIINSVIGNNNAKAIKKCDFIIAVLDGPDIDSGTAAEIGYGAALGKTTIGYRGDYRISKENDGGIVNLQVEYFIHQNGGEIVTSLSDLEIALAKFIKKNSAK